MSVNEDCITSSEWFWKEASAADAPTDAELSEQREPGWCPGGAPPSEVHVLLLEAGLIPHPYVGFNEHAVQWVGERDWVFRQEFRYRADPAKPFASLVFEGLDTICDVYLNGARILQTDNMFRQYSVRVEDSLKQDEHLNVLVLHFKSAKRVAKELEAQFGRVRAGSVNLGDPSRVYLRKAQYDWRWDWGPELMTCGPYRPITLVPFATRFASVDVRPRVSDAPGLAPSLAVHIELEGALHGSLRFIAVLRQLSTDVEIRREDISFPFLGNAADQKRKLHEIVNWKLDGEVELWWPTGYGMQTRYGLTLMLLDAKTGQICDTFERDIGFRRVDLIQEPLAAADRYGEGTTFLFEVNGVRMFMGGSNWIPADNFLTTITPDRYRQWLTLLRDGNQNMVRLWGGGVYEPDVFYEICDELGILVWQDFQFACGVYPAHPEFVKNVRQEAIYNVNRLKYHPCMALFCGNNEDYQQVLQWGDVPDLPARLLYEDILPSVVKDLTDSHIPYHPGSPYGGEGWNTADPTVGDMHQWDVWAGKELAWQNYPVLGGRFISEFGIPAMPDVRTVDFWLDGNRDERWPGSRLMGQHCRAGSHERRFAIVMNENFRPTSDLETHIYQQQLMQSEALGLAYRSWRREWRAEGRQYCGGALVWQLNDCWPVTSWALADYFLRPKLVYYTVARELKPVTVGVLRTVTKNRPNDRPSQFYEFGAFRSVASTIAVWGSNSTLKPVSARLELRAFDLRSDWTHVEQHDVVLLPNQSTEFLEMECPSPGPASEEDALRHVSADRSFTVVVSVRLLSEGGDVLAQFSDWPQPYRHGTYPHSKVSLDVDLEHETVTVSVTKPVKALTLFIDGEGSMARTEAEYSANPTRPGAEVKWSDNCLDVVPGDPQTVVMKGYKGLTPTGGDMAKILYRYFTNIV